MVAIDRLLRANRTILLVPIVDINGVATIISPTGTQCPFSAPTSTILSAWASVVLTSQTGAGRGGNISQAMLDDMTAGFAESDTDDELVITSIGNETTPLFANIDVTLTALRDKSDADTGVFNLATILFVSPDVRYGLIDRIGKAYNAAFAVGDIINAFDINTDNPVDIKEDRGNMKVQQSPSFNGNKLQQYALVS